MPFRISIDCVTFPQGDDTLARWLDDIPENTYTEIDIPSEAPEKCIAFRKDSAWVIVRCSLFTAGDKVFDRVNEISGMNRAAIRQRKGSLILRDSLKWGNDERWHEREQGGIGRMTVIYMKGLGMPQGKPVGICG